jgi:hypothetical protein
MECLVAAREMVNKVTRSYVRHWLPVIHGRSLGSLLQQELTKKPEKTWHVLCASWFQAQ